MKLAIDIWTGESITMLTTRISEEKIKMFHSATYLLPNMMMFSVIPNAGGSKKSNHLNFDNSC
jgi:hypothetical protein